MRFILYELLKRLVSQCGPNIVVTILLQPYWVSNNVFILLKCSQKCQMIQLQTIHWHIGSESVYISIQSVSFALIH